MSSEERFVVIIRRPEMWRQIEPTPIGYWIFMHSIKERIRLRSFDIRRQSWFWNLVMSIGIGHEILISELAISTISWCRIGKIGYHFGYIWSYIGVGDISNLCCNIMKIISLLPCSVHVMWYCYEVVLCRTCVWHQRHVLCTFKNLSYVRLLCLSVWLCRCNHGFKYWPILIHIGNIVSDFEVPDMTLTP